MTPPQWLLFLMLGLLVVGLVAIYRIAGDQISDSLMPAVGFALILTTVVSGSHNLWNGYLEMGLAPTFARVVTVTHLAVMVAVFAYGTYVGHAYVMTDDGHLEPGERRRRYLRARAWNWRRFGPLVLALAVFLVGYPVPARDKWALLADLKWVVPYLIVWFIASSIFAAILRTVREEPKSVGENSASYASLLVLLIWALPLSRRGMEVLGISGFWSGLIAVVLLALLIATLVVAVFVIPAAISGVGSRRRALTVAIVGGIGMVIYLLPLVWNDRPVVHDLTDITGIPFLG